jgi:hypothetical protein
LGHNALYVIVGLVWLFFAEYGTAEEAAIRQDHSSEAARHSVQTPQNQAHSNRSNRLSFGLFAERCVTPS